jgi:hypothetical protein
MVNVEVDAPEVPSDVKTLTVYGPGVAESGIERVQLRPVDVGVDRLAHGIVVELPDEIRVTENALTKFCPVTENAIEVAPRLALVGLKLEITGDAAPMVTALLREADLPSGLITWIFAGPALRPARLMVPVICVAVTETPEAGTGWSPGWIRFTVAPFTKLLPVIVIDRLAPTAPVVGDTEETIGPLPDKIVVTVGGTVGVA